VALGCFGDELPLGDAPVSGAARSVGKNVVSALNDFDTGAAVVLHAEVNLQRSAFGHDLLTTIRADIGPEIADLLVEIGQAEGLGETGQRRNEPPRLGSGILRFVGDDKRIAFGGGPADRYAAADQLESPRGDEVEGQKA